MYAEITVTLVFGKAVVVLEECGNRNATHTSQNLLHHLSEEVVQHEPDHGMHADKDEGGGHLNISLYGYWSKCNVLA
jgi:hypothetical protein